MSRRFLKRDFTLSLQRLDDILDALTNTLGVRFAYEEEAAPAVVAAKLDTATLAGLPQELLNSLEQALGRIDAEAVGRTIEEIRAHDPALADALSGEARDLQFGRLLRLIRTVPGKTGAPDGAWKQQ